MTNMIFTKGKKGKKSEKVPHEDYRESHEDSGILKFLKRVRGHNMSHNERIEQLRSAGTAENTIQSYKKDLKYFWSWAKLAKGVDISYPVQVRLLEDFILDHIEGLDRRTDAMMVEFGFKAQLGMHTITTIRRRVAALCWIHKIRNLENPTTKKIKDLLNAGQRVESKSGRVPKKSRAITDDLIKKMLPTFNTHTIVGKRDKAILLFAFYTGGRRRSEVAKARFEFLTPHQGGYIYLLHRSKTDQAGKGSYKILRRKHALPLTSWIKAADITDGYLFRGITGNKISDKPINPQIVNNIVKEAIEKAGENPKYYSAHGLRRGYITTCARRGISIFDTMAQTDHRDIRTVFAYYEADKISLNPATRI